MENKATNNSQPISAKDSFPRKMVKVLDTTISYIDTGSGELVIFLHGNPTSSYLWRNIIPHLNEGYRCLGPDLVGMGQSGPSPNGHYHFTDQARYLDAWFDKIGLTENITLVLHDWGSAIGLYWAYRHPERVKAIVYMEAIVQPRLWSDFPAGRDQIFRLLKSDKGEQMIYEENFFVETVLPKSIIRKLTDEEMDNYRKPFVDRESRRPTLELARDLPIDGEPEQMAAIVEAYGKWMAGNTIPKLLIVAQPGAVLHGRNLEFARTWPNQQEVTVNGIHYIQEDSPAEIGKATRDFLDALQ